MGRIHLFEFEDQKWFPTFIRNYGTDFLQFLSNKAKIYSPLVPLLVDLLKRSNTHQILDLGSGGGGGLIWLNSELLKYLPDLEIQLSDYYPNIPAFEYTKEQAENFFSFEEAIDARNVPPTLHGVRTLFLAFHHFRPEDAVKILQNAVDSDASIGVFEAQERSFPSFLAMLFSPLSVLFTTPFIRPFKWGRILFTYIIPIVPFFVLWDGLVSCFRTYSISEMKQLVSQVEGHEKYEWNIDKIRSGPGVVLYLTGVRK